MVEEEEMGIEMRVVDLLRLEAGIGAELSLLPRKAAGGEGEVGGGGRSEFLHRPREVAGIGDGRLCEEEGVGGGRSEFLHRPRKVAGIGEEQRGEGEVGGGGRVEFLHRPREVAGIGEGRLCEGEGGVGGRVEFLHRPRRVAGMWRGWGMVLAAWWGMGLPVMGMPILFQTTERGVELIVEDQPVVVVLQAISEAMGFPISIDGSMTNHLNGVYRKRDLESLLRDISPGLAISYRYDEEVGDHVIESVFSAGSVDPVVRDALVRERVVTEQELIDRLREIRPRRAVRYSGIGAAILPSDDGQGIWLQPLSPASPAARAGIEVGDLLVSVNNQPVSSFGNLMEISEAIRGPDQSEVVLTVRQPHGELKTYRIRRETVTWSPPDREEDLPEPPRP